MDIPSPHRGQNLIPTEVRILSEIRTTNEYLGILVKMLTKAFPQLATTETSEQIRAIKKRRKEIGYRSP